MAFAGMEPVEAHLEIINTAKDGTVRIEGNRTDVIFSWMQLTVEIAAAVNVPLPQLLSECAVLGKDFEELNRLAEDCRIDLSKPDRK